MASARTCALTATTRRMPTLHEAHSSRRPATRCHATLEFAKYQGLGNDFILVSASTPGWQECPACVVADAGVGKLPTQTSDGPCASPGT